MAVHSNDALAWCLVPIAVVCLLGKCIESVFKVGAPIGWICCLWVNMTVVGSRVAVHLSLDCE